MGDRRRLRSLLRHPLGVVANQAGLFASPVMEEFGWSRTDATLYMSIQPWVAAICTPFAGKLISRFNLAG